MQTHFVNRYSNYFNLHLRNIQKVWKGVRCFFGKEKGSSPISLNVDNSVITNPKVADSSNDFFSSVANNIRSEIPLTNHHFSQFLQNPNFNSIFLSPVSQEEVIGIVSSFSVSKSTGPNSIPVNILKALACHISKPIVELVNMSFATGIFPSILKTSKVIPVFKKGSPLEASNNRPISLLSNIEKIYEKLMYSRLVSFLNAHNQIYSRQFGFRKSHSTVHTLINIVERIRESLDNGEFACGVFVDLQKAFDTVDHEILLAKLNHYGIRGAANNWLRSYLTGRQQFVSIGSSDSSLKSVSHGVPQGSVLGPLLFLLYINDLHFAIKSSETYHFADDTHLLNFAKSLVSLIRRVNADLKILTTWLNANKISLNAKKTEFIIFRTKSKSLYSSCHLKLQGTRIYPSKSVKYLGVHLDEHLDWKIHVSIVAKELQRANGALSKLRHYMSQKALINIYHAIFSSHIRYACQIWGLCDNYITHQIFTLQKTAMRLITFSEPRAPSNPIFCNLQILKFFDLVEVLNILLVHQHLNLELPLDTLQTLKFEKIRHHIGTRSNSLGLLSRTCANTKSFGLKTLSRLAIQQWNRFQQNLSTIFQI